MGLFASIYRAEHNSSLNVFGGFTKVTLVNVDGPFEPSPDAPAAMLCPGNLRGTVVIRPVEILDAGDPHESKPLRGAMGGAYVATSDSRFSEACEKMLGTRFYGAVPLHDRVEK